MTCCTKGIGYTGGCWFWGFGEDQPDVNTRMLDKKGGFNFPFSETDVGGKFVDRFRFGATRRIASVVGNYDRGYPSSK